MADLGGFEAEPPSTAGSLDFLLKHVGLAANELIPMSLEPCPMYHEEAEKERPETVESLSQQDSDKVVTGLPHSQNMKRPWSEERMNLKQAPAKSVERRAFSEDRRCTELNNGEHILPYCDPLWSVSEINSSSTSLDGHGSEYAPHFLSIHDNYELSNSVMDGQLNPESRCNAAPSSDVEYMDEAIIFEELKHKWILNQSVTYGEDAVREKFYVTYREDDHLYRRVTILLDYRNAPPDSLEWVLSNIKRQSERSFKIYEALRGSLSDIRFLATTTILELSTSNGQLHIHVLEDQDSTIEYPTVDQVQHLNCRHIRERDIVFDSHLSGFVYKVYVHEQLLVKKDIPSPGTVDQFMYEVNVLGTLQHCKSIIALHGVVVDDDDKHITGLLISNAEQGPLMEVMYSSCKEQGTTIPWPTRQRWARQIVQGLTDIHESGFVHGDLTLGNIVVDAAGDAIIIDINRRGCPAGWEPPELEAFIEAHQRVSLYIGVKSDLFQLGMVLWALAMLEDEPEMHGRPLMLGPEINIPDWYRQMTEICLSTDPRKRVASSSLLNMFPEECKGPTILGDETRPSDDYSIDYSSSTQQYIQTVAPSSGWQYSSKTYVDTSPDMDESRYPKRGRSPPRSPVGDRAGCDQPGKVYSSTSWAANRSVRPSYSDIDEVDATQKGNVVDIRVRSDVSLSSGKHNTDVAAYPLTNIKAEGISPKRARRPSLGDGLQAIMTSKLSRQDTAILAPAVVMQSGANLATSKTTEGGETSGESWVSDDCENES
ncbi:Protein kinase domain-containing protein [Metarhizium rileyi]|uniref:EKC/KEOPS complex subunit BUD32 n=1 Tax=Metarhizium rileyi (strain RCEF 4871) TaxID=1649241 RepID=A0A167H786_METRR|nr:Protein kinase domain-containing protein [Metarhizium rileyi RCEF 4871]TWU76667.1 hypothetical protein ED733_008446 [Metarhizium rileyi]